MSQLPDLPPDVPRLIDHIGVAVTSLEEALPLYRDGLGIAPGHPEDVPGMGVRVIKLQLGDSSIELIEGTDPDGVIARFVAKRGPGIHHICLRVDDVEAATRRLQEAGYTPVFEAPRDGADGYRVNFLKPAETGGVLLELAQPPA